MTTRRHFLKMGAAAAATGIVFCGCGLLHRRARRSNGAAETTCHDRRQTDQDHRRARPLPVPRGRRTAWRQRRRDYVRLADGRSRSEVAAAAFIEIDKRLAAMDAQAVDMEVLSINPFWYGSERDLAGQIVKLQNEKLAELCASRPDRFAAFASLTLQAPDLAVQELETAVKKQGLKGAAIGGTVNGEAFSDPKFHPVWAKAEELDVPLFIHPTGIPELAKKLAGNGFLTNTVGYPLETTIALSHLIFEGTFDRFPKLKVIAAHGGGYLPSYADRSDHGCLASPKSCNPDIQLKKQPSEYLKQIYFDSLVFTPEAIRHLVAQVGAGQVVLGSDNPYPFAVASGRPYFRIGLALRRPQGRHPRPHRCTTVESHRLTFTTLSRRLDVS